MGRSGFWVELPFLPFPRDTNSLSTVLHSFRAPHFRGERRGTRREGSPPHPRRARGLTPPQPQPLHSLPACAGEGACLPFPTATLPPSCPPLPAPARPPHPRPACARLSRPRPGPALRPLASTFYTKTLVYRWPNRGPERLALCPGTHSKQDPGFFPSYLPA